MPAFHLESPPVRIPVHILGLFCAGFVLTASGCDRLRKKDPSPKETLALGAEPEDRANTPANQDPRFYQETRPAMGTLFRITVALRGDPKTSEGQKALGEGRQRAVLGAEAAFREVGRVERLFSPHMADSPVSRVNSAALLAPPQAVKVPQEVFNLIHESMQISQRTEGAFDITFGPLASLWKPPAQGSLPSLPTPAAIRQALTLVGHRQITLDYDKTTVQLARQGMRIEFGAIAKGYAVDQMVRVLRSRQLLDFIVDGGGDLFVSGRHPERAWRVGIKDPRKPETYFASFASKDRAVVTSGDYERFFVRDGKRYHHILDPRTGQPASGLSSVTVLHQSACQADALSTAAFVLGPRKGQEFLSKLEGVDYLMVTTRGSILVSPDLKGEIKHRPPTQGD